MNHKERVGAFPKNRGLLRFLFDIERVFDGGFAVAEGLETDGDSLCHPILYARCLMSDRFECVCLFAFCLYPNVFARDFMIFEIVHTEY